MATENALNPPVLKQPASSDNTVAPGKPPKSTAAALLAFMQASDGWAGDDFDDLLSEVYAIRGKVNFDVPVGHQS